jgi:hypothetical protein
LPVVTFEQGLALHVNGERARVVHDPSSHTDGDRVVFFEGSRAVHLGDPFFAGRFPFVVIESGGSVRGLMRSIDLVSAELTREWRVIPGQGPVSSVEDRRAYRAMLEVGVAIVARALARGEGAAGLESKKALAKYAGWGRGFIETDAWIDARARAVGGRRYGTKVIQKPLEKLSCSPQVSGSSRCHTWKYQVEPAVIIPPEVATRSSCENMPAAPDDCTG